MQASSVSNLQSLQESWANRSRLQLQAQYANGQAVGNGSNPQDQINLSTSGLAASQRANPADPMNGLIGMMQQVLQQLFNNVLTPVASLPGSSSSGSASATPGMMDSISSAILAALQGQSSSSDAAKVAGNSNSLLSVLKTMGSSLESKALSTYNTLAAQNQSSLQQLMSSAQGQGVSGRYLSLIGVQESESMSFTAQGQLTTPRVYISLCKRSFGSTLPKLRSCNDRTKTHPNQTRQGRPGTRQAG